MHEKLNPQKAFLERSCTHIALQALQESCVARRLVMAARHLSEDKLVCKQHNTAHTGGCMQEATTLLRLRQLCRNTVTVYVVGGEQRQLAGVAPNSLAQTASYPASHIVEDILPKFGWRVGIQRSEKMVC